MLASELIPLIERHSGRPGVKRGHNTRLLCPGHDDHTPSLDVAAAADARLGQAAGERNRGILRPRVGVMHQAGQVAGAFAAAGPDGLLQAVQDQRGVIAVAARQPRIRRANTSDTNATQAIPAQVGQ